MGGGVELALACRYRVADDAPDTRIGLPEVMLGIVPGWGGAKRLPRLIGAAPALDLMLTGRSVDARRAKKLGLVDSVTPRRHFENAARQVPLEGQPAQRDRGRHRCDCEQDQHQHRDAQRRRRAEEHAADQQQRGPERDEKIELLLIAPPRFGKIAAQLERAPDQDGCLRIRVSPPGHRRRCLILADRWLRHTGRVVVRGQPSADAFEIAGVQLLERPADSPVQKSSPDRAQLGVSHFAQKVVRVIVSAVVLPIDDAPLPQFFERARQAVFIPIGRLGEQIEGE